VLKREQCVCNRGKKVSERPKCIRRNIVASQNVVQHGKFVDRRIIGRRGLDCEMSNGHASFIGPWRDHL
jgi:hypothetical protein